MMHESRLSGHHWVTGCNWCATQLDRPRRARVVYNVMNTTGLIAVQPCECNMVSPSRCSSLQATMEGGLV